MLTTEVNFRHCNITSADPLSKFSLISCICNNCLQQTDTYDSVSMTRQSYKLHSK